MKPASIYKVPITSAFTDRPPPRSQGLRIVAAVAAFVKLLEALFWLAILLESVHDDDTTDNLVAVIVAATFVISLFTGFCSLFGPCFERLNIFYAIVISTLANLLWNSALLIVCFSLGKLV